MYFQVIPEAVFHPRQQQTHCYMRRPCYREMPMNRPHFLQPFLAAAEMKEDDRCRYFMDVLRQTQGRSGKRTSENCCNPNNCQETRKPTANKTVMAKLDFHEFSPEEIKVKITDRNVLVHGRHQEESSFFEVRRSVPLPKHASKPDVVCRYVNGNVILELPVTSQLTDECSREKTSKCAENTEIAEEGEQEKGGAAKKECDRSEEEKKNYELFMKNLQCLQSLFFGIPFSEDKNNKEKEEKEGVKGEDKEEKTTADEEKIETDKMEPSLEKTEDQKPEADGKDESVTEDTKPEADGKDESVTEDKTPEADGKDKSVTEDQKPEADGKDKSVTEEKAENPHIEVDEQTRLFLKYEDPESEPSDDFVHVSAETRDAPETEEHADKTSTEVKDQVEEPAPDHPNFKVELDISKFKPDDIRVVFTDGHVIVSGEREIKGDNYTEVEKWSRRVKLPEGVDESKLNSVVDTDGIMTIEAPYHPTHGKSTPREIQIELED